MSFQLQVIDSRLVDGRVLENKQVSGKRLWVDAGDAYGVFLLLSTTTSIVRDGA